MRTIKLVILTIVGIALMLVLAANMGPVDLHLLPGALGVNASSLTGVPLSMVIVVAVVTGFLIGLLIEYLREGKHRANLARKRREISELREENARLAERLKEQGVEISVLAA